MHGTHTHRHTFGASSTLRFISECKKNVAHMKWHAKLREIEIFVAFDKQKKKKKKAKKLKTKRKKIMNKLKTQMRIRNRQYRSTDTVWLQFAMYMICCTNSHTQTHLKVVWRYTIYLPLFLRTECSLFCCRADCVLIYQRWVRSHTENHILELKR